MPPIISQFYGIRMMMHLKEKEYNPPHIHAHYAGEVARFLIKNGKLYKDEFPNHACEIVKDFINKYKKDLMEMWETGKYWKLPAIK